MKCSYIDLGYFVILSQSPKKMIKKRLVLLYGVLCYLMFLISMLYAIGFLTNLVVPKNINSGDVQLLIVALPINILLLGIFGIQHSVMARQWFKNWWTKIVPTPIERSTYVLISSLLLILLYWKWEPMPSIIWSVENSWASNLIFGLGLFGWVIVFISTFISNHFDLFGLRQVYLFYIGKEYTPIKLKSPMLYRLVRHPIYLGYIIAFWSTPLMTVGHLVFAIGTTTYIFIGIFFEERDLVAVYGKTYTTYKKEVPMLFPFPWKRK